MGVAYVFVYILKEVGSAHAQEQPDVWYPGCKHVDTFTSGIPV